MKSMIRGSSLVAVKRVAKRHSRQVVASSVDGAAKPSFVPHDAKVEVLSWPEL